MKPAARGMVRRGVAALLALILLALPQPGPRHAAAAMPAQSAPMAHGPAHAALPPAGESGQAIPDDGTGLACCIAMQCTAMLGLPSPMLASPVPSWGATLRRQPVPARSPSGIDAPPALPPPRQAA